MTANLQRALRLLEDGFPRVQWVGGGSPQGTGLWSFRGDDGGGSGHGSGGGSGGGDGGADGLLRVSSTGPTEVERAPEQQHAAPREWRRRAQWRAEALRALTWHLERFLFDADYSHNGPSHPVRSEERCLCVVWSNVKP